MLIAIRMLSPWKKHLNECFKLIKEAVIQFSHYGKLSIIPFYTPFIIDLKSVLFDLEQSPV